MANFCLASAKGAARTSRRLKNCSAPRSILCKFLNSKPEIRAGGWVGFSAQRLCTKTTAGRRASNSHYVSPGGNGRRTGQLTAPGRRVFRSSDSPAARRTTQRIVERRGSRASAARLARGGNRGLRSLQQWTACGEPVFHCKRAEEVSRFCAELARA
jgi:hypothetical protein